MVCVQVFFVSPSSCANSSISSRCLSVMFRGTSSLRCTYRFPRELAGPFTRCAPLLRITSRDAGCEPAGILSSTMPSSERRSTVAPSTACDIVTGISTWISSLRRGSRLKYLSSATRSSTIRLPRGIPGSPSAPCPGTCSVMPVSTPAGMSTPVSRLTTSGRPSGPRFWYWKLIFFSHPCTASRKLSCSRYCRSCPRRGPRARPVKSCSKMSSIDWPCAWNPPPPKPCPNGLPPPPPPPSSPACPKLS
mmetsp:Transcript_16937/g.39616  ORF Transcript_16937/g.39616 Transcript_16937/m.39616 type:complete len:248 (-) Transcript_16937:420-1163(-)